MPTRYHLSRDAVLRRLEFPAVYHIPNDELYELDEGAFRFLEGCAGEDGCSGNDDPDFIRMCLAEGILATERQSRERAPVLQSPVPSLRYLELQITNACNLKCRHCYVSQAPRRELTVGQVRDVLDEFREMQGLRLMVTGGEPLVHSRFEEINALLSRYEVRRILFTNGILLTPGILRSLNFHEIQVSIDGMQKGHDLLRGAGSYSVAMRHVEEALAAGVQVSVATMIHSGNLDEFGQMDDLFRGLGVRDWTVDVPCSSESTEEAPVWALPPEVAGPYLRFGFGAGLHGDGEGYACGLHLAAVLPDGMIARCGFYSADPLGTISQGLHKAWKARLPVRLQELECAAAECPMLDTCRGGCRFRASCATDTKDPVTRRVHTGRDLYKCYAYGIMKA